VQKQARQKSKQNKKYREQLSNQAGEWFKITNLKSIKSAWLQAGRQYDEADRMFLF
jgi:hypothetical protein